MARELVHRIQNMRRSAEFDIADYIVTWYQGDDYINQVTTSWADYIRQETLSRELVAETPPDGVYTENFNVYRQMFFFSNGILSINKCVHVSLTRPFTRNKKR